MDTKSWTKEEESLLRSLRLDPIRNDREKLTALVGHFQKGGGVWAVSEAGTGTVLVSRTLARKVRDLHGLPKYPHLIIYSMNSSTLDDRAFRQELPNSTRLVLSLSSIATI